MAASITVHLQIFKRLQLLSFSTDLEETGIKIHGLLRSFIENIVIVKVAVPLKVAPKLCIFLYNAMETTGVRQGIGRMHTDVIVVMHGILCHQIEC